MTTDPAAARDFLRCACSALTRRDVAGEPARCSFCGRTIEATAAEPVTVSSPIVGRRVFKSASLRDLQSPIPNPLNAETPA